MARVFRLTPFFAEVTDTQDRYCHVYHMERISFQIISSSQPDMTFSLVLDVGVGLIRLVAQELILQTT